MARIPAYFAQKPREIAQLPRAPAEQIADVGGGIEAQAIAGAGAVVAGSADIVAKWYEREGNSQFDSQRAVVQDMVGEFERTPFTDADSHKAAYKNLLTNINKQAPKNKSGARKFKSWSKLSKADFDKMSDEKMIRMIDQQNQAALFENLGTIKEYTDRDKAMTELKLLIQGGLDDGSIKTASQAISIQEKATTDWLEADVWRRATAIVRPPDAEGNIEVDWSAAVEWFGRAENIKGIPAEVISSMLSKALTQEAAQNRDDAEKLETLQEQTGRQRITDLWDNILTDPQTITEDLRNNRISLANAKFIRDAMLNPDPPKTDLLAYADGLRAKNDVGRGTKTVNQALDVIYKNVDRLDPATGKSLVNDIFGEHDKYDSDMQKEGRDLMEELIRDKTDLGMFTDDENQIITTAEALVELDASIKNAASFGKPLRGTELLIEAIRIGRNKKRELNIKLYGEKAADVPEFMHRKKAREFTEEDHKMLLGLGKGKFLPDDARLYREPPNYTGTGIEWNALPDKEKERLWLEYEKQPISKGKPPSSPPPKDRAYIGFTVLQDGTSIKWRWDGSKWQRSQ